MQALHDTALTAVSFCLISPDVLSRWSLFSMEHVHLLYQNLLRRTRQGTFSLEASLQLLLALFQTFILENNRFTEKEMLGQINDPSWMRCA